MLGERAMFCGGTTTSFVWDLASALPQVLDDGTQYVLGLGQVAHITSAGTYYYLADGLGSTLCMVDGTGTVVQNYTYDAFGSVKSSSGTQSTEFQFAGEQTDPSGLQFLRARYYDATTGRFLSRDPLTSDDPMGHRAYAYGDANPATERDPSGLGRFDGGDNPFLAPPPPPTPIGTGGIDPPGNHIGHCAEFWYCVAYHTSSQDVLLNFDGQAMYAQYGAAMQGVANAVADRTVDLGKGQAPPVKYIFISTGGTLGPDGIAVLPLGGCGSGGYGCSDPLGNGIWNIWISIATVIGEADGTPPRLNPYQAMSHELAHVYFNSGGNELHCQGSSLYACYPGCPPGGPTPGQGDYIQPPVKDC